jgi:hypothetical protein
MPASLPPQHRRLWHVAGHVGGGTRPTLPLAAASTAAATSESGTRLLRSAWEHNSLELSDRPVQPPGHRVLTDADHAFLAEHGWLLVRGAVPPQTVACCVADTWQY